ncbi:peroxysomal citrate synthase [Trametes punicea]|nr:peroxysomal citrate synthase [Trametes punicea]
MGRPTSSAQLTESVIPQDSLTVRDNRTGKVYTVPIADNAIPATAFKAMTAPRKPGEREENETEKGLCVQDKGFLNTAVIRSEITYIDGEAGVLRYRGYPIEQLALHSSHLETAYLLIYGSLPTKDQYKFFESEVMRHSVMHSDAEGFFRSFRYDAHPMSMLTSAFAMLGSYYSEANPSLQGQRLYTKGDGASLETMDRQIYRLIGKATTLAAMAYRVRQGRNFVTPPTGLSYTGSFVIDCRDCTIAMTAHDCSLLLRFLYQMDHLGEENYVPNPVLEKALDVLFLIHADHELNASCTTVLQTGSSLVDPYSAIAAGCASLYGPLHGGANEAVIRMLISIGSPQNVPAFIEAVKKKEKTLSGFGHRVYKTSDPRSFIVRKTADEVFRVTGKDALLETAMALHDAAMKDDYFIQRKLAPNVDFWYVLCESAARFPLDFFPVLFAVPRVVGWLAHWRQMMLQEGGVKIWRPRQVYVGPARRDYVPVDERVPVEGPKETPSRVEHGGITKRTMLATFKGKSKL